jgi:hypothetical protein
MPDCQVVLPATTRLTLSTGDTVDVITELNAGEYWDLLTARAARQPFALILAYVTGWSLLGLDGQPVPYSLELDAALRLATVRNLNKRIVRELIARLNRHEDAEEAAYAEKKTTPASAPDATRRSASPAAAAGPSPESAP